VFLNIPDNELTKEILWRRLVNMDIDTVYAPTVYANGNPDHNIVGEVSRELWGDKVMSYSTYQLDDLVPSGDIEIIPTTTEVDLKNQALSKYISQHERNRPHFEAVHNKSEYYGNN
jgi:hypothetical protein